MSKKEILIYSLLVLAVIFGELGWHYYKVKAFYGGDLRCWVAECRISK